MKTLLKERVVKVISLWAGKKIFWRIYTVSWKTRSKFHSELRNGFLWGSIFCNTAWSTKVICKTRQNICKTHQNTAVIILYFFSSSLLSSFLDVAQIARSFLGKFLSTTLYNFDVITYYLSTFFRENMFSCLIFQPPIIIYKVHL